MPIITIDLDLPDNANLPPDWDAREFVLAKMQEEGLLVSEQMLQTAGESDEEEDDDPDSWFTPEIRKKARENRRRLEEAAHRNPPKRSKEELLELLLNLPVADEETIKRQDEAREHMRQWKLPW